MTENWFWWKSAYATPVEYIDLCRFIVDYLRDEKSLNNLLYSYSPDVFDSKETYLEAIPAMSIWILWGMTITTVSRQLAPGRIS
ncbi:MAG: hypothetical protein GVY08_13925 [Bacteroidetes bacterium]|jgi:mannan endo-1,4-beta-mannosidase|nr:hypothetical protein [Bacteroidota bacterium]